ncbi:MAG TPA: hypothetical protein VHD57_16840 [Vicinamibacterales bacterium]|nr:hypothetical protein [Vicinamibacterales bacterium]
MSNSIVKSVICGTALLLATALPAAAQGTLGVGVSFLHDTDVTAPGFAVDYSRDFQSTSKGSLGWVADFGLNHFGDFDDTVTTYQGGLRYNVKAGAKATVFGQVVLGAAHDSLGSDTNFVVSPGVGVNVPFNDKAAFRAQVDFPIVKFDGGSNTSTRFWFGVALGLGK